MNERFAEPSLNELFQEPSVRLLMASDGVNEAALRRLLRIVRHTRQPFNVSSPHRLQGGFTMQIASPVSLAGRKALITGIANEQSIAWGCAQALSLLGADVAITYLNEKARPHVEPLARQVSAPLLMPLDVRVEGQLEAVFDRITTEWGRLDCLLHSIAFAPREDLHGRVVDCSKEG